MNRYFNNYQMSKLQGNKVKLHMGEYLNNKIDNNEALFVSNNKPYNRL